MIPCHSYLSEVLAVVDTNDGAGHLGDDDHVPQVGLDDLGLLIWGSLLLGLAQLLDQGHRLALQTTGETPAGTAVHQLHQLVAVRGKTRLLRITLAESLPNSLGHVQKLVQVDTAVGELLEGTLLLQIFVDLLDIGKTKLNWPAKRTAILQK